MKKFLIYTFTYLLVTVAAAFGTMTIGPMLGGNTTTVITAPTDEVERELSDGEKLINKLLSISNTNVNLEFDIYDNTETYSVSQASAEPAMKVKFDGSLSIEDLENIKVAGTLSANVNGQDIVIKIVLVDKVLYLSNETMTIKLKDASLAKLMELLPTLGLKMNLGVDFSTIDTNELLADLQSLKATKVADNKLKMTFNLTDDIYFDIFTDAEYSIKSIATNRMQLAGKTATINASLDGDNVDDISNPDTDNSYVDVTNTINIVDNIKEILTNKRLHLNLDAGLVGATNIALVGDVDMDYNNDANLYAEFDANLGGTVHKISIGYIDDDVYVGFNSLKFVIDQANLEGTIEAISKHFDIEEAQANMLVTIAKIIPGFELSKVLEGDFSNININNLLAFAKGEDNVINITIYGKAIGIENDLNLVISLDDNDQFESLSISNISLLDSKFSAKITYSPEVTIPDLKSAGYVNMLDVPNMVSAILATVKDIKEDNFCSVTIDTDIVVDGVNIGIAGVASIDFRQSDNIIVFADIVASINGHDIAVKVGLDGEDIYIIIADQLRLTCKISDVAGLINSGIRMVNDTDTVAIINAVLSLTKEPSVLLDLIRGNIDKLPTDLLNNIESTLGKLNIKLNKDYLNLSQDLVISVLYNTKITGVTIEDIQIDNCSVDLRLGLNNNLYRYDFDSYQYISLSNANTLMDAIINTINDYNETGKLAVTLSTELDIMGTSVAVSGDIATEDGIVYINMDVRTDNFGLRVVAYIVDGKLYADIDGLKVSITLDKIGDLAAVIGMSQDVKDAFGGILPNIDIDKLRDFDFSGIDFGVLKSVEILDNKTTIVIDKSLLSSNSDIEVVLAYDEAINGLKITGLDTEMLGLDLIANTIDIDIPTMTGDYSSLDNISDLAAAITDMVNTLQSTKTIAADIDTTITYKDNKYNLTGTIYVDYSAMTDQLDLTALDAYAAVTFGDYSANIRLYNGYLYIDALGQKLKIAVTSIFDLIDVLQNNLDVNIDVAPMLDNIKSSVIGKALQGDYSAISPSLIAAINLTGDQLDITLDRSIISANTDFDITIKYDDRINSVAIAGLKLLDCGININANIVYEYVVPQLIEAEYSDISGVAGAVKAVRNTINNVIDNQEIALGINNANIQLGSKIFEVNGMIYANWANAIVDTEDGKKLDIAGLNAAIKLQAVEAGYTHNILAVYDGSRIYLTYNHLNLSVATDKIKSVVDLVKIFQFLSNSLKTEDINNVSMRDLVAEAMDKATAEAGEFDLMATIKGLLPNIDIDNIMSGDIDLTILQNIVIDNSNINVVINGDSISSASNMHINLTFADYIDTISIAGLNRTDIAASGSVAILRQFDTITIDQNVEYVDLDNVDKPIYSALNTAIDVIDNKHIAFGINTNLVHSSLTKNSSGVTTAETETVVEVLDGSNARFDWNNAYTMDGEVNRFDVKQMKMYFGFNVKTITNTYKYSNGVKDNNATKSVERMHYIEISYYNNVIYIRYNNMYAKINGDSIDQIVNVLCEILGIDASTDTINNLIGMIGQKTDKSMLDNLSIDMLKSIALSENKFALRLDLSGLGLGVDAINNLALDVDYDNNGLQLVTIHDLAFANIAVNDVYIDLNNWSDISEPANANYIDLSGVGDLLETIKNTMEYRDFHFNGSVNLKIEMPIINTIDWNIPLDIKIKLLPDNQFEAEAILSNIPAITAVNDDVPFKAGKSVEGINVGKNRTLSIKIRDGKVYIYRTEDVPWGTGLLVTGYKKYEKKLMVAMETFLDDPLNYTLQYGMGFSQKIMDEIYKSVNKERVNPIDYSNVLKGFASDGSYHQLTLNLRELAENDKLDTMSLGIRDTNINGKDIVGAITFNMFMPLTDSVKITLASTNLAHQDIGSVIDFSVLYNYINNYGYNEGAEWDAYEGNWNLSSQRQFTLNYVTNCNTTIPSVTGIAGSELALPTLATYITEEGDTRTTHIFEGWYTTIDYQAGTEYIENVMPRRDTTLYAKWQDINESYIYITFVTNGGDSVETIRALQGAAVDLPYYYDLMVVEDGEETLTKKFAGWSLTADCLDMVATPFSSNDNVTLYAKWDVISRTKPYQLTIMDGSTTIISRKVLPNTAIDWNIDKVVDTTLLYLDSECTTQVTRQDYVTMPEKDVTLYIRNQYSLHISSQYGSVIDTTTMIYQGETITLPTQASYVEDDGNTRTTYTFAGYYIGDTAINGSTYVMPNSNLEIVAKWNIDVKHYYTITFDMGYNYIPYPCAEGSGYKTAPQQFAAIRRLEGDVDLSAYKTSCEIYRTAFKNKSVKYSQSGWSKSVPNNYSNGGGSWTINITGNTTVYPCWQKN